MLDDPIEELYNAVTKLHGNEPRQITWWLEPRAYIFDIVRSGQDIVLTIWETDDLHNAKHPQKRLLTINTPANQIIEPFRIALRQFCAQKYKRNNWKHNFVVDK